MARGISLHIGLNEINPNNYDGFLGKLNACENDANDMLSIAKSCGYETKLLLTKEATSTCVLREIGLASKELAVGDIFLLTYSGHGTRVQDISGDEEDGLDETWVLYDRMLIDDELYVMWSNFKPGVRIVVVSDSCHSGSVIKDLSSNTIGKGFFPEFYNEPERSTYKTIPLDISVAAYERNIELYESIQWLCAKGDRQTVTAGVILFGACQDNQTASDGHRNSLFTKILKTVWNEGKYSDYKSFWNLLVQNAPPLQSPSYYKTGAVNQDFEEQSPFTI